MILLLVYDELPKYAHLVLSFSWCVLPYLSPCVAFSDNQRQIKNVLSTTQVPLVPCVIVTWITDNYSPWKLLSSTKKTEQFDFPRRDCGFGRSVVLLASYSDVIAGCICNRIAIGNRHASPFASGPPP